MPRLRLFYLPRRLGAHFDVNPGTALADDGKWRVHRMEIVNQIAGSLAQSASVTRQQSTDKSRQIRRAQALRKDVAAQADTFEHQVESSEELNAIHDEQTQRDPKRKRRQSAAPKPPTPNGDPPGIDLTA